MNGYVLIDELSYFPVNSYAKVQLQKQVWYFANEINVYFAIEWSSLGQRWVGKLDGNSVCMKKFKVNQS